MKRLGRWLLRRLNLWIALALLLANLLAWQAAASTTLPPPPEPRLDPALAEVREKMWSGQHKGERFQLVITEQDAEEGFAWSLAKRPEIPFSHPQVEIDPQGITGRGLVLAAGLAIPVWGRFSVSALDGKPLIAVQQIGFGGVAVPGFARQLVEEQLDLRIQEARNMPVYFTKIELQDGQMLLEGEYR